MLQLHNISASVGDKEILHDINLTVNAGEVHVLLGPNGSGKSSILAAIMGLSPFEVTEGEVLYKGQNIGGLDIDERAQAGLGMAFQRPPAIEAFRSPSSPPLLTPARRWRRKPARSTWATSPGGMWSSAFPAARSNAGKF